MASVIAISGGFLSITLQRYAHVNIPWGYLTAILTALAVLMMIRGVGLSTKIAGFFFGFEMLVLIIVSVTTLIKNGGHLSAIPFEPSHITNGFSGLAAGFPLAIYLFIGWENSAALAEETDNPRRNVPRAVFTSVAIMGVSYVVFAYATVSGFGYNVTKLGAAPIPFISVADSTIGVLAFFAYLAGMTSTLGALIAGTNSQARLVFNAGREGLMPGWIGHVNAARRTPMNAIFTFVGISALIIGGWALLHLIGGQHRLARPDQLLRRVLHDGHDPGARRLPAGQPGPAVLLPPVPARMSSASSSTRVLPVLGAIAIIVPLYYLAKPGQPTPYDWFPYAALIIVVVAGGLRLRPQLARPRPGRPRRLHRRRRITPGRLAVRLCPLIREHNRTANAIMASAARPEGRSAARPEGAVAARPEGAVSRPPGGGRSSRPPGEGRPRSGPRGPAPGGGHPRVPGDVPPPPGVARRCAAAG